MKRISRLHLLAAAALTLPLALSAATLTGTVTDKTTNKPSAGDDVVLIALGQGMQEAGRTKTDARGRFSIDLPDAGMHLIRVDHEKANYFEPAPPGTTTVHVDVYDVAAKVEGVSTEADVLRIETDQQGLHVIENFFVKNDSNPPRTQFSSRAYEIGLPPDAQIEASAAMGPSGMPVSSSPMPTGVKGHYAFVFPVRPGETRFQVTYKLPYSGSYKFALSEALPAANVAVLLPNSMKFAAAPGASFQPITDNIQAQTFVAKNVAAGQPLDFTVSGSGVMPRDSQSAQSENGQPTTPEQGSAAAQADTRPGGGLGNPIDTPDPLQKYKWWILSGLALVLAIAAAFLLRARPAASAAQAEPPPSPLTPTPPRMIPVGRSSREALLAALKDELFALETERVEGKIGEAEYAELKTAFETVLRRALTRDAVTL